MKYQSIGSLVCFCLLISANTPAAVSYVDINSSVELADAPPAPGLQRSPAEAQARSSERNNSPPWRN